MSLYTYITVNKILTGLIKKLKHTFYIKKRHLLNKTGINNNKTLYKHIIFVRLLGGQARGGLVELAAREPHAVRAQPAQLRQPHRGPPVRVPRDRAERGRPVAAQHQQPAGQGGRS